LILHSYCRVTANFDVGTVKQSSGQVVWNWNVISLVVLVDASYVASNHSTLSCRKGEQDPIEVPDEPPVKVVV
jgi:hypothetical protein